jgi:hypothetical protein
MGWLVMKTASVSGFFLAGNSIFANGPVRLHHLIQAIPFRWRIHGSSVRLPPEQDEASVHERMQRRP